MITLKGLVLKEADRGETSKSVCVMTAEKGLIYVFVRGGKKSTKNNSSTQAFAYSSLCLEEKKNAKGQVSYFLNSSEPLKLFYNLRLDAKKLALASYFSELLIYSGIESAGCEEIMRLTLNTLYFLDNGKRDMDLLKCIFEFRLLCEIGIMPNLIGCTNCCAYEHEVMYFNFTENNLECGDCCYKTESLNRFALDKTLLYIVRYIALTDFERLFSFNISPKYQQQLSVFTERFVFKHLKEKFISLDFYKMI